MNKKRSLIVTIIFGLSTFLALILQIVVARYFGTKESLGQYLVAITLSSTLVSVFYATVNDVFLPIYSKKLHKNEKEAVLLAGAWLKQLVKIGMGITILLFFGAKVILLNFFTHPSELTIQIAKITSFVPLIALVNALLISINYAHENFYMPPLVQVGSTALSILIVLVGYQKLRIWVLVIAFILAMLAQLLILTITTKRRVSFSKKVQIKLKDVLMPWLPILSAYLFFKTDMFLIRTGAAKVSAEYVSIVNYAVGVIIASAGLVTIGIRVLIIPLLSKAIAKKEIIRAKQLVRKTQLIGLSLSVANALFWLGVGKYVLSFVFVRGEFDYQSLQKVVFSLKLFLPATLGWSMFSLFSTPLYVIQKQRFVAKVSLAGFLIGFGLIHILNAMNFNKMLLAPIAVTTMFYFDILLLASKWYLKEEKQL